MKILITFSNQEKKPEVITPFLGLDNCDATDTELVVPGVVKIQFHKDNIECFCLGLDIAEKILSNVCTVQVDNSGNNGYISFPKSLNGLTLESKIFDFKKVMELASTGKVQYINTEKKALKAIVPLSQWLSADIVIDDSKAFIHLKFIDYEIMVSDGSALQFVSRVKEHPLISAASLGNYFDFGSEIKLKPLIEYMCFWKILKSDNGYKKYATFINECKDRITITYDEGRKYRCDFEGGKVDFQLLSIGDKYPKKVTIQIDTLKDSVVLESLQRCLSFKTIDLVCKVSNLKFSPLKLVQKLHFFKDEDFFVFSNMKEKFKAQYDISGGTMMVKQEFNIADIIDYETLELNLTECKKWVDHIINQSE